MLIFWRHFDSSNDEHGHWINSLKIWWILWTFPSHIAKSIKYGGKNHLKYDNVLYLFIFIFVFIRYDCKQLSLHFWVCTFYWNLVWQSWHVIYLSYRNLKCPIVLALFRTFVLYQFGSSNITEWYWSIDISRIFVISFGRV